MIVEAIVHCFSFINQLTMNDELCKDGLNNESYTDGQRGLVLPNFFVSQGTDSVAKALWDKIDYQLTQLT